MKDTIKLVENARSALRVAIRTITDGTTPKASGFDHLNRSQISAAQISHVERALSFLGQISYEPSTGAVFEAAVHTVDLALLDSIRTTNKALALLLKQPSIDPSISELCIEHDIRVQKLLMLNPFAFKALPPIPTRYDDLLPKPQPFLGFTPCKICHSRFTLVITMQSLQCSDCDAEAKTPSEWNELNRTPLLKSPLGEETI